MRLVIDHLTRMKHPYVCVAGIDETQAHKRPVLGAGQLGRQLLTGSGGPFSLGAVVDLGVVRPRPTAPEVEDVVFLPRDTKVVDHMKSPDFVNLLEHTAKDSLGSIFGAELVRKSGTAAGVPIGKGNASLGVLRLDTAELQSRERFDKPEIRLIFADPISGELSIKVTDLRLWEADQVTPAIGNIQAIRNELDACLVAVGLTRPFQVGSYPGVWHWLQINNVFPREEPLWTRE